jgi:hypothetical protein
MIPVVLILDVMYERENDNSAPSNADINNTWSVISRAPIFYHSVVFRHEDFNFSS